jgi:large subunit ribosomal protein L35
MQKRLAVTSTGKLKRRRARASHLMEHKSTDRKREKHGVTDLAKADHDRAKKLIAS